MADEALVYEGRIAVPYAWSAGITGTRFFLALKERRAFLGTRCPSCRKVHLPPVKTCGSCFKECAEWLEVGPRGTLLCFTQARYKTPAQPVENPIYGLIRLDGADTALLHLLGGAAFEEFKAGMAVEPVFLEEGFPERWGIRHFKPAPGKAGGL